MPLVILIVAIVLIAAGFNGQWDKLRGLVLNDVQPTTDNGGGFGVWIFVILALGIIGYYDKLTGVSRLFLLLIFIVIFISNKGFFENISNVFTGTIAGKSGNPNKVK